MAKYWRIAKTFVARTDLTAAQKLIWTVLEANGQDNASSLSSETGQDAKQVRRELRGLEKMGLAESVLTSDGERYWNIKFVPEEGEKEDFGGGI